MADAFAALGHDRSFFSAEAAGVLIRAHDERGERRAEEVLAAHPGDMGVLSQLASAYEAAGDRARNRRRRSRKRRR